MTDKMIEVPRELLERLHRCADFLRLDGMGDAADQAEALLRAPAKEAVTPDNGWKCKTCGRGQDAFHWGCDTEGWDRPAHTDNEGEPLPSKSDDLEAMRRDAELLDWLCNHGDYDTSEILNGDGFTQYRVLFWTGSRTLKDAILAAIAAEKREG